MKSNFKIIIIAIIAVAIGLGAGYLIFGKNMDTGATPSGVHEHEMGTTNISSSEEIWICSMHPQIRQNEPGDCPICGMDLIPASSNESDDPLVLQMTESAVKLANIQTTVIATSTNSLEGKTLQLSGKVQVDERLASSQVTHVPGRIEKLYVTFTGEQVAVGQKLADIYSPDLIAAQSELLEALKLQSINPGLLEAARNKLRFWKIPNSTITKIEENEKIQETFSLYASESGVVTNRRVAVGDYLKQGEPLFDLISLKKVWVLFDAYEEQLATIKVGSSIEFTSPAIPNKTFKTKVTFIDPLIDSKTRTAAIRTEVSNKGGQLKPEMFVQGVLKGKASGGNPLTVPKSAVLWTGVRSVVYVSVPDVTIPSFKYKEIEIGESLGNSYQVISGLEAGEEVVTYGSFTIDAAAQLNNQASMMNKMVTVKGDDKAMHLPDYTGSTPAEFRDQLSTLTEAYLLLKDALVATDSENARTAAQEVVMVLSKIDMSLLEGEAHLYWMKQLEALEAHGTKISELTEVEEQRKQFDFFSQALINSVKAFGIPDDTLYIQHCPMVSNNEGADWISKLEAIQNPYFGDKMMKCGTVKTIIDKDFKNPVVRKTARN